MYNLTISENYVFIFLVFLPPFTEYNIAGLGIIFIPYIQAPAISLKVIFYFI